MKSSNLLVIFLYSISHALAYDVPGAYERVFYYYAYLLDTADGTSATKIATGCSNAMKTKDGKRCSFNQFIEYINADRTRTDFSVLNDDDGAPDVDRTAKLLADKGLTGAYTCSKIRGDVGRNEVASLITNVGAFLGGKINDASESQQLALKQSIQAVWRSRQAASVTPMRSALAALSPSVELVTKQIAVFDGSSEKIDIIDEKGTQEANGLTKAEAGQAMRGVIDKQHHANIQAAMKAEKVVFCE